MAAGAASIGDGKDDGSDPRRNRTLARFRPAELRRRPAGFDHGGDAPLPSGHQRLCRGHPGAGRSRRDRLADAGRPVHAGQDVGGVSAALAQHAHRQKERRP